MIHNFYKTKLVFQVLKYIQQHRQDQLNGLVAHSNNPMDSAWRMRILSNLAQYEYQFLEKMRNFESDCAEDYLIFHIFEFEIKALTDVNA